MKMTTQFTLMAALTAATALAGVKDNFTDDFKIGVALNAWQFREAKVSALIREHFNSVVAENCMKSGLIHPEENRWNFTDADALVDFAEKNGLEIVFHTLVWHSQTPGWLFKNADGSTVSRETLIARMKNHIETIMNRYRGRIKRFEVLNEAIEDNGELRRSPWLKIIGADYIELAFKFAHEANPDAELYYNDYNMESPGKLHRTIQLVTALRQKGLRIDGIGSQTHIGLASPSVENYEKMLIACELAGVRVSVTEMDVSVLPWTMEKPTADIAARSAYDKKYDPYRAGLPDDVSRRLADRYAEMFRLFRRHAANIDRVTLWGLDDGSSWLNHFPVRGRVDYPLLFDRNLKPKACLRALETLPREPRANTAWFDFFNYSGRNVDFDQAKVGLNTALNPVVTGFYPDPSVCRVGDTYYLVNSTFAYFPGVAVLQSKDLVNWTQTGNALSGPFQFDYRHPHVSGGVFAPAITYNPHNKLFYMITTATWNELGNFYVTTPDPAIGWSAPKKIDAQFQGIDPSFFFDDDGKAYIVHNTDPEGGAAYEGQRAIRVWEFDVEKGQIYGKDRSVELTKGSRPEEKPIWPEGPHIFKRNGWYYLMCAEGGTSVNHTEVIFRSRKPMGPYTPYEKNPILTQRDLPWEREQPVMCAGHADLVTDQDGKWWAVFLATRPREDCTFMGRETFVAPVEWADDWPVITRPKELIPFAFEKPGQTRVAAPLAGDFVRNEDFNGRELGPEWLFLYTPHRRYDRLENGRLGLEVAPDSLRSEKCDLAARFRRQAHHVFTAETKMTFTPENENECAGLALFQNHKQNVIFGLTDVDGKPSLVVTSRDRDEVRTLGVVTLPDVAHGQPIWLKLATRGRYGDFLWSLDGQTFQPVARDVDLHNVTPERGGGFVGNVIGLYATRAWQSDLSATKK